MTTTDVDICNRALSRLGTRSTIAALDENSTEARAASIWYAATRDALLRVHDWNFARHRVTLGELGGAPAGWTYRYALPSDCLRLLRIVSARGDRRPARFEVVSDGALRSVLSDEPEAEAIYTMRVVDPTLYDAAFSAALVDQLAAHIAYPVTQKTEVAVRLAQMARATLADAMVANAGEAMSPTDRLPDWIEGRS